MFIIWPLCPPTVQRSLVSQFRNFHCTLHMFILTKLHEFVICKGAKRIVWNKIGAEIIFNCCSLDDKCEYTYVKWERNVHL